MSIIKGAVIQAGTVLFDKARTPSEIGLAPETLASIHEGLYKVVHSSKGTASKTNLSQYSVCGKTSSAQAGRDKNSHAWFAGYAPADNPKHVVVTFVEYGGHGGEAAAPPAARIFEALAATP